MDKENRSYTARAASFSKKRAGQADEVYTMRDGTLLTDS